MRVVVVPCESGCLSDDAEEVGLGESAYAFKCAVCGAIFGLHDEPRGAGRDPYGRPSPRKHPEFWTE